MYSILHPKSLNICPIASNRRPVSKQPHGTSNVFDCEEGRVAKNFTVFGEQNFVNCDASVIQHLASTSGCVWFFFIFQKPNFIIIILFIFHHIPKQVKKQSTGLVFKCEDISLPIQEA